MTNHNPTFTSSSESGSFSETSNTTGSTTLHLLSGTLNFKELRHNRYAHGFGGPQFGLVGGGYHPHVVT